MGLLSDDWERRSEALRRFHDEVVLGKQGFENVDLGWGISSILKNDVPLLVVPFLIEMLSLDGLQEKITILDWLYSMAWYVDLKNEGDIYMERARQVRAAVWSGFETYTRLLLHPEPRVRNIAAELLGIFTEHAQQVFTPLIQLLKTEEDINAVVMTLRTLSFFLIDKATLLPDALEEYRFLLRNFLKPEYADPIRLTAAVFLSEHFGTIPEVVETIKDVLRRRPDRGIEPYTYFTYFDLRYPFWSKIEAILGNRQ